VFCKDVIMVIPGFVETSQMVKCIINARDKHKRAHEHNGDIKFCILEPISFKIGKH